MDFREFFKYLSGMFPEDAPTFEPYCTYDWASGVLEFVTKDCSVLERDYYDYHRSLSKISRSIVIMFDTHKQDVIGFRVDLGYMFRTNAESYILNNALIMNWMLSTDRESKLDYELDCSRFLTKVLNFCVDQDHQDYSNLCKLIIGSGVSIEHRNQRATYQYV